MHYSICFSASFMALAFASPMPSNTGTTTKLLKDGSTVTISPAHEKRHITLGDGSIATVSDAYADDSLASQMEKRGADKISSCGPRSGWTPIEDHGMHLDQMMWGYRSAVTAFCSRVAHGTNNDGTDSPLIVAAGTRISVTVKWQNDGRDVKDDLRGPRVGLKNDVPGHIEFEVNNKREKKSENDYIIEQNSCVSYLMNMASTTSSCYGPNNQDTKGGTWQKEDNKLTFHALPGPDGDANIVHDEFRA